MKVMINAFACDGHAQCVAVAPDVFQMGSDRKAYARSVNVPEDQRDAVREAKQRCPQRAVMILDKPD
jgi:ferredoxin